MKETTVMINGLPHTVQVPGGVDVVRDDPQEKERVPRNKVKRPANKSTASE